MAGKESLAQKLIASHLEKPSEFASWSWSTQYSREGISQTSKALSPPSTFPPEITLTNQDKLYEIRLLNTISGM